jgi:hypothetical protein
VSLTFPSRCPISSASNSSYMKHGSLPQASSALLFFPLFCLWSRNEAMSPTSRTPKTFIFSRSLRVLRLLCLSPHTQLPEQRSFWELLTLCLPPLVHLQSSPLSETLPANARFEHARSRDVQLPLEVKGITATKRKNAYLYFSPHHPRTQIP